ncbi:MAG: GNAT family N-acetyltransferase [Polyangiaceae bacterium]
MRAARAEAPSTSELGQAIAIAALGAGDLVDLAQAYALDASVFPHLSLPVLAGDRRARIWTARALSGHRFRGRERPRKDTLDVVGLAVDPSHRGLGIGRALLREVIADAGQELRCRRILLHVSTTNVAALALYASEGFARAERRPGFYSAACNFGDGGDAWRMVRPV